MNLTKLPAESLKTLGFLRTQSVRLTVLCGIYSWFWSGADSTKGHFDSKISTDAENEKILQQAKLLNQTSLCNTNVLNYSLGFAWTATDRAIR